MEIFGGTVAVPSGKLFENYSLCINNFPVKWNVINFPGGTISLSIEPKAFIFIAKPIAE